MCTCKDEQLSLHGCAALCQSCAEEYAAWAQQLCCVCGEAGDCEVCRDECAAMITEERLAA